MWPSATQLSDIPYYVFPPNYLSLISIVLHQIIKITVLFNKRQLFRVSTLPHTNSEIMFLFNIPIFILDNIAYIRYPTVSVQKHCNSGTVHRPDDLSDAKPTVSKPVKDVHNSFIKLTKYPRYDKFDNYLVSVSHWWNALAATAYCLRRTSFSSWRFCSTINSSSRSYNVAPNILHKLSFFIQKQDISTNLHPKFYSQYLYHVILLQLNEEMLHDTLAQVNNCLSQTDTNYHFSIFV